jgi:hypothetical protein
VQKIKSLIGYKISFYGVFDLRPKNSKIKNLVLRVLGTLKYIVAKIGSFGKQLAEK